MNRYIFNDLTQAYMDGLTSGLMRASLQLSTEMEKRERKCSRVSCPLQRDLNSDNNFNDTECRKACQWYTPEFTIDDTIYLLENLLALAKQQKKERMVQNNEFKQRGLHS